MATTSFGTTIYILLKKKGIDCSLFEKKNALLSGASTNNLNRVHFGYHYPRDNLTAKQSYTGYLSFRNLYKKTLIQNFSNYYLIAKNSKVNLVKYLKFCKKNKLYFKELNLKKLKFKLNKIEGGIQVKEPIYDWNLMKNEIQCLVKKFKKNNIYLNEEIKIINKAKKYKLITNRGTYYYDIVIDASYDGSNSLIKKIIKPIERKYQLVVIFEFKLKNFKKLGLALIGYGNFGKIYFKSIIKSNLFKLNVIFRKNIEGSNRFKILSKKNLKKFNIEAAIVCTPVKTHHTISKLLIENKIPIILEKPATDTLSQISNLIRLSKKNKTSVLVNHSDLFNENFKFLLSKKKKIGKIKFIDAKFGRFSQQYKKKNELPYKDWLSHPLALIFKFVKKINYLSIISNKIIKKKDSYFQELIIHFKAENAVEGRIIFNNLNKDKNRILKVYGEKGKICYDGYNNKNNYLFIDKKIVPTKLNLSPLQTIIKNFYKNIKENKFYSDLEYSYKIQKILLKLQKKINFK